MAIKTILFTATGAGSYTLPANFQSLVSIEAIGAGGGGSASSANLGGGSGGGAYAKTTSITAVSLAPGTVMYYNVPAGGAFVSFGNGQVGGDAWVNFASNAAPTVSTQGVLAKGGQGGSISASTYVLGGQAASCVGSTTFSGGRGASWIGTGNTRGGGGGAAGPNGAGGDGAFGQRQAADDGNGGGGGGANGGSNATPGSTTSRTGGSGGNNRFGVGGGVGALSVAGAAGSNGGGGAGGGYLASGTAGGAGSQENIWTSSVTGDVAGPGGGPGAGNVGALGGAKAGYGSGAAGANGGAAANGAGGNGIIVLQYNDNGIIPTVTGFRHRLSNTGIFQTASYLNEFIDDPTTPVTPRILASSVTCILDETATTTNKMAIKTGGTIQTIGEFDEVTPLSGGGIIVTNQLSIRLDSDNLSSNPRSGTTWFDINPNVAARNASLSGTSFGPPTDPGGASIIFNGTSSFASFATGAINTGGTAYSLCFWIRRTTSATGQTIFSGTSGNSCLQIRYDTAGGQIQLVKSGIAVMNSFANSDTTVGNIANIVITKNASNLWSCYINGVFKSSFTSAQTFTQTLPGLGKNFNGEYASAKFYSFFYYTKELSAAEVTQNYSAYASKFAGQI